MEVALAAAEAETSALDFELFVTERADALLRVWMEAGIHQDGSVRVLDHVDRHGHGDPPVLTASER